MFEDKNNGHTCYCENCLKLQAENEQLYKEKEQLYKEKEQLYKEKKQLQKSQYCVAYEKDCHLVCKQSGCKLKDYHKYKQCLDEIENILKEHSPFFTNTPLYMINQLIKQAKENN